ncbi:MAG: cysteine peptidase family C39 domain-containing protein, partial [Aquimonas sp.]
MKPVSVRTAPAPFPPVAIRATEAAECGLAALAMVANSLGYRCSLAELRQRFSLSLKGATLGQLVAMAGKLGLQSRPLRLELSELGQLATPCILHWDLNHFVVLAKVDRAGVVILDPARGERRMRLDEASRHFTGVALELSPGPDFQPRPQAPRVSWRQLAGRTQGLWRALALVFGLSMALQVFVLLAPFFLQWTVDQVLVSADRDLLTVLGLAFGLSLLLQVVIASLRGWTVVALSAQIGLQWSANVFAHLLRLPMAYFEKRHLGDIVSRMGSVGTLQRTLTHSFVEAIVDGLMATATLVLMLVYSGTLALITLAAVALYLALRFATFRAFRERSEAQLEAAATQQTHLLESIRGMQSL